jgi:hypothetical protein
VRADRSVAEGFANDGLAVFDAATATRDGAVLLADRGERIEEVARAVLDVAASLAELQAEVTARLSALDADVNHVITQYNSVQVRGPDPASVAAAVTAAEQRHLRTAVELVSTAGARIRSELDAYGAMLVSRTARLAGLGYGSPTAAPAGDPASIDAPDLGALLAGAGDVLGALAGAVRDNPEAVLGFLVGLGAVAAGASLVAGGAVVTGGTGGAGVVVGGPAVGGGFALLGVGGALLMAAAGEIARDAADGLPASTAAAPEAKRAGVRESVLDPDGALPGEPGRRRGCGWSMSSGPRRSRGPSGIGWGRRIG